MIYRRRVLALISLLAILLTPASGMAAERQVTIGAMYNLTGGQQSLDIPSSQGARLAVDEINRKGGLFGQPVKLLLVDGKTDPTFIAKATAKLFNEAPSLAGVIGFSDTDMVLAAAPVAAKRRRVFLTSGATSPKLPQQIPKYLFLACFGDNVQAAVGAEWAFNTRKARTAVVLYKKSSSYARLLRGYFETRFKQLGGKVLATRPYALDNFKTALAKLPQADVIYLSAQPDDIAIAVPALRDAGIKAPILGGDGLDIGEAWQKVPRADKIYFTTHAYLGADNPDPRVQQFRKRYAAAYPGKTPDAFTALGYDTARLLMAAIRTVGSAQPNAVRKALAATKNFAGVTGTISYRNGSRIPAKSVTVMSVDGGKQKFVATVLPKKIPAP